MIRTRRTLDPFSGRWLAYQTQSDADGVTWHSFDGWQTSSRDRGRAMKKAAKAVLERVNEKIVA